MYLGRQPACVLQIQVIGKLLDRLDRDGPELSCKKQDVTRDVNWRYDTAIAWLTQARDEVLHDVTAREETIQRDIEAEKISARGKMERLSAVQARASHMNDSNLDLVLLKNDMQSALMSDDALEQHRSRAAVENTDSSFACESAASLFDLHIAQQYIGNLRSVCTGVCSATPTASFGDLTRQVVDLKTEVEKISKHISSSDVQTASRELSFNNLKKQVEDMKTGLTKDTTSPPKKIKVAVAKLQKTVSFHARLSGSNLEVSSRAKIIFNDLRLSEGGGYDSKTGVFSVPVAGTYAFLATIGNSTSKGTVHAYFVVDGVDCTRAHGSPTSVGSCHVVLKMAVGQKVWLRAGGEPSYSFFYIDTFFSGFLIQAE
ncbi:hypothetical protein BaRGS_00008330 [Batillaria attramentaria]|uniref:C1q domain-containing protein n=1 Tax=Batillaria attramentaria TaxID=370345 RepID=A0ABD0LLV8_9CAEN